MASASGIYTRAALNAFVERILINAKADTVLHGPHDEFTVMMRYRNEWPADATLGTPFQRSFYFYLALVSTPAELYGIVADVEASGQSIAPFTNAEDVLHVPESDLERDARVARERALADRRARDAIEHERKRNEERERARKLAHEAAMKEMNERRNKAAYRLRVANERRERERALAMEAVRIERERLVAERDAVALKASVVKKKLTEDASKIKATVDELTEDPTPVEEKRLEQLLLALQAEQTTYRVEQAKLVATVAALDKKINEMGTGGGTGGGGSGGTGGGAKSTKKVPSSSSNKELQRAEAAYAADQIELALATVAVAEAEETLLAQQNAGRAGPALAPFLKKLEDARQHEIELSNIVLRDQGVVEEVASRTAPTVATTKPETTVAPSSPPAATPTNDLAKRKEARIAARKARDAALKTPLSAEALRLQRELDVAEDKLDILTVDRDKVKAAFAKEKASFEAKTWDDPEERADRRQSLIEAEDELKGVATEVEVASKLVAKLALDIIANAKLEVDKAAAAEAARLAAAKKEANKEKVERMVKEAQLAFEQKELETRQLLSNVRDRDFKLSEAAKSALANVDSFLSADQYEKAIGVLVQINDETSVESLLYFQLILDLLVGLAKAVTHGWEVPKSEHNNRIRDALRTIADKKPATRDDYVAFYVPLSEISTSLKVVLAQNVEAIAKAQALKDKNARDVSRKGGMEISPQPNRDLLVMKNGMTASNFMFDGDTCPFDAAFTALFKRGGYGLITKINTASKVFPNNNVIDPSAKDPMTLHVLIVDAIHHLQSDSSAPVSLAMLRTAWKQFFNIGNGINDMEDVNVIIEHLCRFYDVPVLTSYNGYTSKAVLTEYSEDPKERAPEIIIMRSPYTTIVKDPLPIEDEFGLHGNTYTLMACASFRGGIHWVSYVRDADDKWYKFDALMEINRTLSTREHITKGVREIHATTGLHVDERPMSWIYAKRNTPTINAVCAALETVEIDPRYSSKERGLHYDAIESDLLPVLSAAYNRNAHVIAQSPRLKAALAPLTANGGAMDLSERDEYAQVRHFHWLGVVGELLGTLDKGEPVDDFLRDRCIAEKPV